MRKAIAAVLLAATACGGTAALPPDQTPAPTPTPSPIVTPAPPAEPACGIYWQIEVDVSERKLTVFRLCEPALRTSVGVGKRATPTPLGRFKLTGLFNLPGAYGPFVYTLNARSAVLPNFGGGNGTIGIHGTALPSDAGTAVSHGCIRVPDRALRWMVKRLPLRVPVWVHA